MSEANNPYESPTRDASNQFADQVEASRVEEGDGTGGVIPYKNPKALIAYYLGIFGMFPMIGIFASIPAAILGGMGLRDAKKNPAIRGHVHAWIGIVLGVLCTLANLTCWVLMAGAILSA